MAKEIWIIGGGKFGQRAVRSLKEQYPDAAITIVEKNVQTCQSLQSVFSRVVCVDGVDYLKDHLKVSAAPRWIVPAVPVHVAFCWFRAKLLPDVGLEPMELPDALLDRLPHPFKGRNQEVYVSVADFLCPEDCPEPATCCTKTRQPRLFNLYEKIEAECPQGVLPVVIRSRQLAPGVGGISPRDLFEALEKIKAASVPVLVGTACKCHGVVSGFKKIRGIGKKDR